MTTILVSIGIVTAFAILFWLDKKQGPEHTPAIVHLFYVLRNLNMDMSEQNIRDKFEGFKTTKAVRLNKKTTLTHKQNHEGQGVATTFSFAVDSTRSVNKCEIRLSRINDKDIDLLFSTVCKAYGQPEQSISVIEGAVKWATEPGTLTLENTAPEEYLLTIKEEEDTERQRTRVSKS